jgi:glutamyl-tRNA synthetase
MAENIRVRFAPSPTGPLHVGGLRTALFNYLFAKQSGGKFILRIEDTDKKRKVDGAEQYIVSALKWCGISADESIVAGGDVGPYRQSERNHLYKKHLRTLTDKGLAYYAFDSEEDLNRHREDHQKKGKTFIYNWHNRLKLKNSLSLSKKDTDKLLKSGEPFVIRFKASEDKQIVTEDVIRGRVTTESRTLDDKVLCKADGTPTYHLANVVDDHLMEITHVIRGEEWLPSLPLHFMLYDAFGWDKPVFAHLPLILNPNGKGKLSKRSGEKGGFPVFPISWSGNESFDGFREAGILPKALVNYLATLGWSPKEGVEIISGQELLEMFQIEKVVKAAANFDFERLKWFNHKYIQQKDDAELANILIELEAECSEIDKEKLIKAIGLVKERAETVKELWGLSKYLFHDPAKMKAENRGRFEKSEFENFDKIYKDGKIIRGPRAGYESWDGVEAYYAGSIYNQAMGRGWHETLKRVLEVCSKLKGKRSDGFIDQVISPKLMTSYRGKEKEAKPGKMMMLIRIVLVGNLSGVDLQKIVNFIGVEEVEKRVRLFIKTETGFDPNDKERFG